VTQPGGTVRTTANTRAWKPGPSTRRGAWGMGRSGMAGAYARSVAEGNGFQAVTRMSLDEGLGLSCPARASARSVPGVHAWNIAHHDPAWIAASFADPDANTRSSAGDLDVSGRDADAVSGSGSRRLSLLPATEASLVSSGCG